LLACDNVDALRTCDKLEVSWSQDNSRWTVVVHLICVDYICQILLFIASCDVVHTEAVLCRAHTHTTILTSTLHIFLSIRWSPELSKI